MKASVSNIAAVAGLLVCIGLMLQATASAEMSTQYRPKPSPSRNPPSSPVGSSPIRADLKTARRAYPWCKTSMTTSYALEPAVRTQTNATSGEQEFVFAMQEDYGACLDDAKRKGRDAALCRSPFYSFMIAISEMCHEAVMIVNTVQLTMREDRANATAAAMYCHSHKGHDTGVPLLKFLAKPSYLEPNTTAPYAKRRFVFKMRMMPRDAEQAHCADIRHLCGGDTCMVALSDEEYDICPAYIARIL